MKRPWNKKLRSQKGASISFALLLFLVCGILCSVILTAATAASGRMSEIAEVDQRYYAVTSAAELLKDLIDGEIVSIVEETTTETITTYTNGVAGTPPKTLSEKKVYLVNKPANQIGFSVDSDWVRVDTSPPPTFSSIPQAAAYQVYNATTDNTLTLELTADGAASMETTKKNALSVAINATLKSNGTIHLAAFNNNDEKKQYTLYLTFGADQSESTSTSSQSDTSEAKKNGGQVTYSVTTKTVTLTIKTLTWHLDEIKTAKGGTTSETGA